MDLRKRIETQRQKALEKLKTPENCTAARNLLEGLISEKLLGEDQWWTHTANHRVITFYSTLRSGRYYILYNTDTSIGASLSDPLYDISKEVLSVAVALANEYKISAEEFVEGKANEEKTIAYRFEVCL